MSLHPEEGVQSVHGSSHVRSNNKIGRKDISAVCAELIMAFKCNFTFEFIENSLISVVSLFCRTPDKLFKAAL
jgi:hypothetical protein